MAANAEGLADGPALAFIRSGKLDEVDWRTKAE